MLTSDPGEALVECSAVHACVHEALLWSVERRAKERHHIWVRDLREHSHFGHELLIARKACSSAERRVLSKHLDGDRCA